MKLLEPKCCNECFFIRNINDITICGNDSFPEELKILNYTAFKINPLTVPEWCPIKKCNKMIEGLPPEKQEAFNNIYKGLQALFGQDKKEEGDSK